MQTFAIRFIAIIARVLVLQCYTCSLYEMVSKTAPSLNLGKIYAVLRFRVYLNGYGFYAVIDLFQSLINH